MLKIKNEYLGQKIKKGNETIFLTNDLTQDQLSYIKIMISDCFVEDIVAKPQPKEDSIAKVQAKEYMFTKKKKNADNK